MLRLTELYRARARLLRCFLPWLVATSLVGYLGFEYLLEARPRPLYVAGAVLLLAAMVLFGAGWMACRLALLLQACRDGSRALATCSEELQHSHRELDEALQRLTETQSELIEAEKLASLGMLVAGAAHELSAPVAAANMVVGTLQQQLEALELSLAQGLRRSELDAFLRHMSEGLDIAGHNLQQGAELIQRFKRLAADRATCQRREFALDEVVEDLLQGLAVRARHSPHRLLCELAPGLRLDSFPGPLGQVLQNLIDNALVHAFENIAEGKIRLSARPGSDPGTIVVQVADNGVGIAPEIRERIFEPFFTTRRGRGGSGLGLSLVQQLVTRVLGGTLGVSSGEGVGTIFSLTLPTRAPEPLPLLMPAKSAQFARMV
ncbi:sensor histidine kinase [Pseudogulbenkiania sp. MAI-1]|uniref:sensor histidine kinase n=1 Tax=Pseudogulbenkiania sp. MAI-1 TaxID=990370 RepID=UPI00045EABFB|nr:ATP-binding protein [Pseudogulbenkiania sp. MAI-1]